MFNAVRMDIYRLIHTKSAYVILVIAMALAIAMSGMTALVRSMAAESIVETTDEVTMVSESDSEIADEYDTASAESSNGPTATVGLEMDESDMSDEVPTIADMVESDIAGLDLALLLAIFTVLFSLIFSGINILIEKIGVKNFDINDYLIVNQISELDLSSSAKTVGGAFAIAAVWAVVSLIAVYGVFKRRDI